MYYGLGLVGDNKIKKVALNQFSRWEGNVK